jgi:fibronectin-binding autotransporter adhesin
LLACTLNAAVVAFGTGSGTLNFNHTASNYVFAPTVTGNGAVNVLSGTTTLTAANTYTGETTISAGMLNITNSSALGSTAGGTTVASGATLQLQGSIAVGNEPLSLAGSGFGGAGALKNVSGNNSFAGLVRELRTLVVVAIS